MAMTSFFWNLPVSWCWKAGMDIRAARCFGTKPLAVLSTPLPHITPSGTEGKPSGLLNKDVLKRLKEFVVEHLDEPLDVATLAKMTNRSQFHFSRAFTRSVGVSPYRYVVHLRLQRAVEMVRDRKLSLAEIAVRTGFADQSHLTRWVRRVHGVSPTQILRKS